MSKNNKHLNLKKTLSVLLLLAGLVLLFTSRVDAKECHSVYGGGEVCERVFLRLRCLLFFVIIFFDKYNFVNNFYLRITLYHTVTAVSILL